MNRIGAATAQNNKSMPHVCGDEPVQTGIEIAWKMVCPTYVGMNRRY